MVKTLFILILSAFFISFPSNQEKKISIVKIYLVKWDSRYTLIRTISNIKETALFYFETKDVDLHEMFYDYKDCISKLKSQEKIIESISATTNVCVEMYFGKKVVKLYFKNSGEYYFEDSWYKMNSALYYYLFLFFSNELIPHETLEIAKNNTQDYFWHTDK